MDDWKDVRKFTFDIVEGHDPGGYYWFRPVAIPNPEDIKDEDVIEYDEVFSIEWTEAEYLLGSFFSDYFDRDLVYNRNRHKYEGYSNTDFDAVLTHNFYTYATCKEMIAMIRKVGYALGHFPCIMANDTDTKDKIVDFHYRFADRLTSMMENNPSTDIISIMGP